MSATHDEDRRSDDRIERAAHEQGVDRAGQGEHAIAMVRMDSEGEHVIAMVSMDSGGGVSKPSIVPGKVKP